MGRSLGDGPLILCAICCVFLCGIGFIIYSVVKFVNREKWPKEDTTKYFPEDIVYMKWEKSLISQWEWKYTLEEYYTNDGTNWLPEGFLADSEGFSDVKFKHRCPSDNNDVDLYVGDDWYAGSDETLSTSEPDLFWQGGADDAAKTLADFDFENDFGTAAWVREGGHVSATVTEAGGDAWNFVYYEKDPDPWLVNGTQWGLASDRQDELDDWWEVRKASSTVAHVRRWLDLGGGGWEVFVDQPDAVDPRAIVLLLGKWSFAPGVMDGTDKCNEFVFWGLWIPVVVCALAVCLCFVFVVMFCKGKYEGINASVNAKRAAVDEDSDSDPKIEIQIARVNKPKDEPMSPHDPNTNIDL